MIPNKADTVEVISSGFGDSFGMTIDENSIVHLMDILTKMYSDAALACIREYSANAYDSHIKAGQTRPIEVTLPNRWSKTFIVRDYGVGMNVEYMRNVYSKYGASDKQDSDDYIGGFGIGSKAGLAYTRSFTVTAWQNGRRVRAIVSLGEDGAGKFDIVDDVESDEEQGVEISIPIHDDTSDFYRKAQKFFAFWPEDTVLIDGFEPDRNSEGWNELSSTLSWKRGTGYWDREDSHVIAGVVGYPIDMSQIPSGEKLQACGIAVRLIVGVSDVSIAPNREQLAYTPSTIQVIDDQLKTVYESIVQAELDRIAALTTFKEAHQAISGIDRIFAQDRRFQNMTWNGVSYRQRINHPNFQLTWDWQDKCYADERHAIDIGTTLGRTELIVTGFDGKRLSTIIRRKIAQYCDDNGLANDHTIVVNSDIDDEWLSDITRVTMDTIKAVKLPAGTRVNVKSAPKYDVYDANGHQFTETIPSVKTLYYASPVDLKQVERYGVNSRVNVTKLAQLMDATIVVMSRNRFDKFMRDFPHAEKLGPAVQAKIDHYASLADGMDVSEEALGWGESHFLRNAPANEIDDPDLAGIINLAQGTTQVNDNLAKAKDLYSVARRGTLYLKAPVRKDNEAKDILARYPLIDNGGYHTHMDHMVLYINAVYAKENN